MPGQEGIVPDNRLNTTHSLSGIPSIMTQQQIVLTLLSLATVVALGIFPVFRGWLASVSRYRIEALFLVLLFIGLMFLGGERTPGTATLLDPLRIARIIDYTLLTGLSLLLLIGGHGSARINAALIAMGVYGVVAIGTAAYSVYPPLTLWKGFEVITHVCVAMLIARRATSIQTTNELYGLVWLILTYLIATFLWGALLYPDDAFRPFLDNTGRIASEGTFGSGLRGTFPKLHLNSVTQVGAIMAISAIAYLAAYPERRRKPMLILLAASLSVVLLGHSRTSIFAFVAAVFVMALYVRHKGIRITVLVSGTILGVTAAVSGVISEYLLRGQTEEQFASLTGRLPFWEIVIDSIMESPFFGYGFYAGTRMLLGLPGVDNTYLNVMMGGGLFLLIIFLTPIFITARNIYVSRPRKTAAGQNPHYQLLWMQTAGLFILLVTRSLSGPSFDANHFNLILFLICTIGAAVLARHRNATNTGDIKTANKEQATPSTPAGHARILRRRRKQ